MRWLVLLAVAAAAVAALGWFVRPQAPIPAPRAAARVVPPLQGQDAARALAEIDATIGALKTRIASPYGDMFDYEQLSIAHVGRAKLTGDFGDLLAAQTSLDAAFATSPPGMGPWLAKAAAAFSAHRIDVAAAALDRVDRFVVPDRQTLAEARAIRADIAMARGADGEAARLLSEAEAIDRWPGLYFRKALLARLRGDFDGARRLFAEAEAANPNPTPLFLADMRLRQGELDFAQGRWDEARRHYAAAARMLPGYWRADMRVAQMMAIGGDTRGALARFEAIAERLGDPDAMYVAAGLNKDLGEAARSRMWVDRAARVWTVRLAQLPEAAWAHALEHELAWGDPGRALVLAGRNVRNRPDALSLLLLAEAWLANGRPDYALALCRRVESKGWVLADQWTIRAVALDALGRRSEAAAARARAEALNPRENDPNPALAWFHN